MDLLKPSPLFPIFALAALAGCSATVEVQTNPISQTVPVLSVGVDSYAEVAVDIPAHSQGDIVIQQLIGDVQVVNPSNATTMTFSLRITTEGTAEPDVPKLFTEVNLPPYFNAATVLVPNRAFGADTTTPVRIESPELIELINHPRIYIIVGNTVSNVGFGDLLPVEIQLKDLTFNVLVTKHLGGLGGGLETVGL